jgi:hypothetical protein
MIFLSALEYKILPGMNLWKKVEFFDKLMNNTSILKFLII